MKNADKMHDPEMRQTRKGQQWLLGVKLQFDVDSATRFGRSAVVTTANVHGK